MPAYDFKCQDCETVYEARVPMQELNKSKLPKCPRCQSTNVKQVFRSVSFNRGRSQRGGCCGPSCNC
ncbi:MAG: zinc ribbon domain-containing protein [Firmicutes bacterium]|nr:zinc ribbon domain-containing protein [Bacillota bacterium]